MKPKTEVDIEEIVTRVVARALTERLGPAPQNDRPGMEAD